MTINVRDIYTSGNYLKKNPDWHTKAAPWKAQAILALLKRNQIMPSSIGDIGCGSGEILRILQQQYGTQCDLWGYDVAPQAIELAQQRTNDHLHFKLADFRYEQDVHYDVLLLIDVLQHIEDWYGYLQTIKPRSTYKVLQLPTDISVSSILQNEMVQYYHTAGHLHFYDKDTMLEILKVLGYEVVDYCYTHPPFYLIPREARRGLAWKVLKTCQNAVKFGLAGLIYKLNPDLAVRLFGIWRLMIVIK